MDTNTNFKENILMTSPGRPKADIDWKRVDDLLIVGCSGKEIAASIGVNYHTLYDRCFTDHGIQFSEYSQSKYAKGDSILRAHQFAKAIGKTTEGDNTLLIWLGKNRLGQKEKPEGDVADINLAKLLDLLKSSLIAQEDKPQE